jgi:hypothetical protein
MTEIGNSKVTTALKTSVLPATMDQRIFLEISPSESDGGELIGKGPAGTAFGNPGPEIQGADSPEGPSGAVLRLLLRCRQRGPQVCCD